MPTLARFNCVPGGALLAALCLCVATSSAQSLPEQPSRQTARAAAKLHPAPHLDAIAALAKKIAAAPDADPEIWGNDLRVAFERAYGDITSTPKNAGMSGWAIRRALVCTALHVRVCVAEALATLPTDAENLSPIMAEVTRFGMKAEDLKNRIAEAKAYAAQIEPVPASVPVSAPVVASPGLTQVSPTVQTATVPAAAQPLHVVVQRPLPVRGAPRKPIQSMADGWFDPNNAYNIGAVVGGTALAILLLAFLLRRRKRASAWENHDATESAPPETLDHANSAHAAVASEPAAPPPREETLEERAAKESLAIEAALAQAARDFKTLRDSALTHIVPPEFEKMARSMPQTVIKSNAIHIARSDNHEMSSRALLGTLHQAYSTIAPFRELLGKDLPPALSQHWSVIQQWGDAIDDVRHSLMDQFEAQNWPIDLPSVARPANLTAALAFLLENAAFFAALLKVQGRRDSPLFQCSMNMPAALTHLYWARQTKTTIATLSAQATDNIPTLTATPAPATNLALHSA